MSAPAVKEYPCEEEAHHGSMSVTSEADDQTCSKCSAEIPAKSEYYYCAGTNGQGDCRFIACNTCAPLPPKAKSLDLKPLEKALPTPAPAPVADAPKCKKKHVMALNKCLKGATCDKCRANCPKGKPIYECTPCDYDLCNKCAPLPRVNAKFSNELFEGLGLVFFSSTERKSLNPSDPEIDAFMSAWEELDEKNLPTKLFKQDQPMTHLYAFLSAKTIVNIMEFWNDPKSYWYQVNAGKERYNQDLLYVLGAGRVFAQSLSSDKYLTSGEITRNNEGKKAKVCLARLSIDKLKALSQSHQDRIKNVYERRVEWVTKGIAEVTKLFDWNELTKNRSESAEDAALVPELIKQYNSLNQPEQPGECHAMIVNKNPATGNVYGVDIDPLTRLPTQRHSYVHMAIEFKKDGILRYRIASFHAFYDASSQKWGPPRLGHWYRDIDIGSGEYEKRIDPQTIKK